MNIPSLKRKLHNLIRAVGYDVSRYPPPDFDRDTIDTIQAVRGYTLTSPERIYALCEAVRYVVRRRIPGSVVECGVWRGGSMMAAARTLLQVGDQSRDLWLYDTFEGMVEPGPLDRFMNGRSAAELLAREDPDDGSIPWCRVELGEVQAAMRSVGYPEAKVHFVKGPVEETLPEQRPDEIAILRLDTDWYASTRHELLHLVPLLSPGGVLLIDDYGAWEGARRAVDEYFSQFDGNVLLSRIDSSGRIAVMPSVPVHHQNPGRVGDD